MPGFLLIGDEAHRVTAAPGSRPDPGATVAVDGDSIWIQLDGAAHELRWRSELSYFADEGTTASDDVLRAPMPGTVVGVSAAAGDQVAVGDLLMVVESMKLETAIRAPRDGIVEAVHTCIGQSFDRDDVLVSLAAPVSA